MGVGRGVALSTCFSRSVIPHWTEKTALSKTVFLAIETIMENQTAQQHSATSEQKKSTSASVGKACSCLGCAVPILLIIVLLVFAPKAEDQVDKLLEKYVIAQQQDDKTAKKKIEDEVSKEIDSECIRAFEEFRMNPLYKKACENSFGTGSSVWNWSLASCSIDGNKKRITVQARTEIDGKKVQIMIRRESDRTYHVFDVMVDQKQFWHETTGFNN